MTLLAEAPARPRFDAPVVLGNAPVASLLAARLGVSHQALEDLETLSGSGVLVSVSGWHPALERRVNRACRAARRAWLRVRLEGLYAEIGPFSDPHEPGCLECAETRRYRASEFPDGFLERQRAFDEGKAELPQVLTSAARAVLLELISAELEAWRRDPTAVRTARAVLRLNLETLTLQRHAFLPDSHCPTCAQRESDTRDGARLALRSRPKPRDALRLRDLNDERDAILETYVDGHLGIVNRLSKHTGNLFANASASTLYPNNTKPDRGFGRGLDFQRSQLSAIMEALERYGGMQSGAKRTAVRGSFAANEHQALDPRRLGLHEDELYDQPDFGYRRFTPDAEIDWVWGYSLQRHQPILVPEGAVYYGEPLALPGFAYECSNGCALGGSLEEAILYGLLEIAERDAFLIAWHARLELPEIDLETLTDPALRLQLERLRVQTGFELRALDATMENDIPTVLMMAVRREPRADQPAFLCAAGSHLCFEKDIANALGELAPNAGFFAEPYQKNLAHISAMIENPYLCAQLEDHQLLYAHPAMRPSLEFWLRDAPRLPLEAITARHESIERFGDLLEDLNGLVRRFQRDGHEVVVVDQSTSEHRALGFHCVKVIVTGHLPMTFGHGHRRLAQLPRLLEIPHRLGFRSRPLTMSEVDTAPHAFP
jgi:ribosomal protein S12 methylthiotransferase accessory factor